MCWAATTFITHIFSRTLGLFAHVNVSWSRTNALLLVSWSQPNKMSAAAIQFTVPVSDYNRLLYCEAAFANAEADPGLEEFYECNTDVDEAEEEDETAEEVLFSLAAGNRLHSLALAFLHRFCCWPVMFLASWKDCTAWMPPFLTARQRRWPIVA
jgi:hypothetical protein